MFFQRINLVSSQLLQFSDSAGKVRLALPRHSPLQGVVLSLVPGGAFTLVRDVGVRGGRHGQTRGFVVGVLVGGEWQAIETPRIGDQGVRGAVQLKEIGKRSAVPAAHGPGAVRSGVAESPLHLVFGHDLVPGVPGGGQDGTGHFHGVLTGGRGDTGRLLATLSGDRPQAFHARRRGNTGGDGHVVMDAPTRGDALRGANMDLLLTEDPREGRRLVGVEGVEGDVSHWGFLSGFVSRAPDHEWSAAQANTWSAPSTPGTGPVGPDA